VQAVGVCEFACHGFYGNRYKLKKDDGLVIYFWIVVYENVQPKDENGVPFVPWPPNTKMYNWIKGNEYEHVDDFRQWENEGKRISKEVEELYVNNSAYWAPSKNDCEIRITRWINRRLQSSLRDAQRKSREKYDIEPWPVPAGNIWPKHSLGYYNAYIR